MKEETKYLFKCPNCSGVIRSDNNYCDYCGKLILPPTTSQRETLTWSPLILASAVKGIPRLIKQKVGGHDQAGKISTIVTVSIIIAFWLYAILISLLTEPHPSVGDLVGGGIVMLIASAIGFYLIRFLVGLVLRIVIK